jgi:serine/threonine protein kinase
MHFSLNKLFKFIIMPLGLYTASLNFETKKEIGAEGRNSQVFLAHDKQLDGELVIKKIAKSSIPLAQEYYTESKLLYNSRHQNIVQVNYGCEDQDHIYIAMPYYKNGSLKSLIDKKFLTVREIIRYSLQYLSGLNHIHTKGLMHFDIKPDNILLSDSNEALLADFGLAKAMNNFGFSTQESVYPRQVPPERFSQKVFSVQYDIYLAGLTLYRLCNGNQHFYQQINFVDENAYIDAIRKGSFPNRKLYLPHIPKKLQKIINKAIHVDPAKRHNNVLELMNELGSVDTHLDCQFIPQKGISKWELKELEKTYDIELIQNASNFEISTYKTMNASGNRTKVHANCFTSIAPDQIQSTLEQILKNL